MSDALTSTQVREVEQLAELQVRRYFDTYLRDVWPQQQKLLREHTHLMIEQHDASDAAHGGVEKKLNRMLWIFMGVGVAGGGAGAGLAQVIPGLLG